MTIVDYILPIGEYYADIRKKESIFIHHTAGGHRPDWTIDGWANDRAKTGGKLAVGTAYVIGGNSTSSLQVEYDGVVYRAFDEKYWAHHLGLKQQNNRTLNQRSIAIEICNYGPLTKTKEGIYLNYVNKPVPQTMVEVLDQPYRGFRYYHKYTDKQLDSLRVLILDISKRHSIDIKKGMVEYMAPQFSTNQAFELSDDAIAGKAGLWTHSNVRRDKTDCHPSPGLISLISSL